MRPRFRLAWWWAPIILFVGLVAGGLLAPDAHASPVEDYAAINAGRVCATLDDFPSVAGVTGVVQGVMEDGGFTPYDAGRIVGMAVMGWCPEHLPELRRFVAVYSQARTVRA
jgi:hypothetical protein